jgi:hypothetical protein
MTETREEGMVCGNCRYFIPSAGPQKEGKGRCDCSDRLKLRKKNWWLSEARNAQDPACEFFKPKKRRRGSE